MNPPDTERLYHLLPAVYRLRDAGQGSPLRALLAVIEREHDRLEADIAGLYDNWFIETCDEWVIPYIGELLGVRGLYTLGSGAVSARAQVANTIRYRRRKGTAAMLEQLARDVTGWPAHAVEFFERLAATQHLNHPRPTNHGAPDLRDSERLALLAGPFGSAARTVEVRRIEPGRGRYNIPNVGLFLWRLQSYAVTRAAARPVSDPPDGRYTFDPRGGDGPLFNRPRTEQSITHLAEEINVPGRLRRRPLATELAAIQSGEEAVAGDTYFGNGAPVFAVAMDGRPGDGTLPPESLSICDLSDWRRPTPTGADPWPVAVDPVLGRLAFPAGGPPGTVRVSYSYGAPGDLGGGPYDRQESVAAWTDSLRPFTWQIGVAQDRALVADDADAAQVVTNLGAALTAWNDYVAQSSDPILSGLITIRDSSTYPENLTGSAAIRIPAGCRLVIVAADWAAVGADDSSPLAERLLALDRCPHLRGDLAVQGTARAAGTGPGSLVLDGLSIEGSLRVLSGPLDRLDLAHCTLMPPAGSAAMALRTAAGGGPAVSIRRSICGPLNLAAPLTQLTITDSIIDGGDGPAIQAADGEADLQSVTVFGSSTVRSLTAGNCLFTGPVAVARHQVGCVRFSYLPAGSRTPSAYRCQPDLALRDVDPAEQAAVRTRLTPAFTATRYGDPAYAQLRLDVAPEIRAGAEDGAEMGAYRFLQQPQRETNLRVRLNEYLRFGLEAGIFYVS